MFWANSVITALHDDSGAVTGFVGIARDLTERKRMEDELRTLSVTDPLTASFPQADQALGINNSNVIAGFYADANGNSHGFTYSLTKSTISAFKSAT